MHIYCLRNTVCKTAWTINFEYFNKDHLPPFFIYIRRLPLNPFGNTQIRSFIIYLWMQYVMDPFSVRYVISNSQCMHQFLVTRFKKPKTASMKYLQCNF